jgi:hypothetical protein
MSSDHPSPPSLRQQSLFETSDDSPPNSSRESEKKGRVWSVCRQCGVEFEHIRSWPHKRCDECRPTVFLPMSERLEMSTNTGIERRTCPQCGAEFTVHASRNKTCCSKPCGARYHRQKCRETGATPPGRKKTGHEAPCEWCATPFYVKPSAAAKGHGRFCSVDCTNAWQARDSVIDACEWCGKSMIMSPSVSKGQRFCSFPCQAEGRRKQFLERTHNGKRVYQDPDGYIMVWEPDHPRSSIYNGWYQEHRLVMEQQIGRVLRSDEHVHHRRPGEKWNNDPSNLEILSPSEHQRVTSAETKAKRKAEKAELVRLRDENAALRARVDGGSEVAS